MNLIEAIFEMKNGKVTISSNLLIYRIKDETIEYFYESNWIKTGLSVLELSELTFEITEMPYETLSDKIFTIPECRNGVIKLNVIPSHDVQDFINHLKNKKNYKLLGTDLAHYDMFIEQIDKHAGEKFK